MQEIKCPNCGKIFQVDEAGYAAIVRQVRDREFEKEELIDQIMEKYSGVTREQAKADIDGFLKVLADHFILDDGVHRGRVTVKIPRKADDNGI